MPLPWAGALVSAWWVGSISAFNVTMIFERATGTTAAHLLLVALLRKESIGFYGRELEPYR